MSIQYCFDITQKDDNLDVDYVKNKIRKLYTDGDDLFESGSEPFVVIYVESDNHFCISLTKKGKKIIEKIEKINNSISSKQLKYRNVTLSKPYKFVNKQETWWNKDKDKGDHDDTQDNQGDNQGDNRDNQNDNVDTQNAMNNTTARHKIQQQPTKSGKRWSHIIQKGPYFAHIFEPYTRLNASLIYNGKKYTLTDKEEKIACFYARRIISEEKGGVVEMLTKDPLFNKNFWEDYKKILTPEHLSIFTNFSKIDWSDVVQKLNAQKDNVKTNDQKNIKKEELEERKRKYGYAILDGNTEKVGNFNVEPASIFYGRGDNKNRGKIKYDINPEDITINVGVDDPVPAPPNGHQWKAVVHDYSSIWLARWNDTITGNIKYVMFSHEGKFKGENDLAKYEKARKLEKFIQVVRDRYVDDAKSKDVRNMQLGTVLFLIDNYGIRVGNERSEDEVDTVGASTLRVDHVKLKDKKLVFDFLGKDSIRFYKEMDVPDFIYQNFKNKLISNKGPSEQIFDKIDSNDINNYLKEFDASFSAKVFRTRLASVLMNDELQNVRIPTGSSKATIKALFNKANAKVADVLNHVKNVSKKTQESIDVLKQELKDLEKDLNKNGDDAKKSKASKISKLKDKITSKEDVMTVAINTSLTNYIDPRLIVSWSKKQNIGVENVYSSTLMTKFNWAVSTTDEDWDYIDTPLVDTQELEPVTKIHKPKVMADKQPRNFNLKNIFKHKNILEVRNTTKNTISNTNTNNTNNNTNDVSDFKVLELICRDMKNAEMIQNVRTKNIKIVRDMSNYAVQQGLSKNVIFNEFINYYYDELKKQNID
jgi:DNA topoisomerase-1